MKVPTKETMILYPEREIRGLKFRGTTTRFTRNGPGTPWECLDVMTISVENPNVPGLVVDILEVHQGDFGTTIEFDGYHFNGIDIADTKIAGSEDWWATQPTGLTEAELRERIRRDLVAGAWHRPYDYECSFD